MAQQHAPDSAQDDERFGTKKDIREAQHPDGSGLRLFAYAARK
jgi:hypothetical protein